MTLSPGVVVAPHELPMTPWAEFIAGWRWRQGEHVTAIGPTGTGKTTLLRALVRTRYDAGGAVAVLATKSTDAALDSWARQDGLTTIREWPPKPPQLWRPPRDLLTPDGRRVSWKHRVMLWPRPRDVELGELDARQAAVFRRAITEMFWQGRWCVVGEELFELTNRLGLEREFIQLWGQGRSAGLSVLGATQRPIGIPLWAYSQASHLFMFADPDEVNLQRLRGIGGVNSERLIGQVATLPEHDVLYLSTRARTVVRTRVPVIQRKAS